MNQVTQVTFRFDPERAAAVVAVVFGIATILAGGSVLLGRDPGYLVYRPLLIFNTAMGFVYAGTGLAAWRRDGAAVTAAMAILVVNIAVLVRVVYLFLTTRDMVAEDSVRAMTLRTMVWLILWALLGWVQRKKASATD